MGVVGAPCVEAFAAVGAFERLGILDGLRLQLHRVPFLGMLKSQVLVQILLVLIRPRAVLACVAPGYLSATF